MLSQVIYFIISFSKPLMGIVVLNDSLTKYIDKAVFIQRIENMHTKRFAETFIFLYFTLNLMFLKCYLYGNRYESQLNWKYCFETRVILFCLSHV